MSTYLNKIVEIFAIIIAETVTCNQQVGIYISQNIKLMMCKE